MYFIYTLSDPRTGEIRYVGKTNNLNVRFWAHLSDKSKSYKSSWIKSLKQEYLLPIMEVIEEYLDEEDCYEAEVYWVSQLKTWGFRLTNLTEGGKGAFRAKRSEETKKKNSSSLKDFYKNNPHHAKGKKYTDEHKKKLSEAHKGRAISEQAKQKLRDKRINKPLSEEHKEKLRISRIGKGGESHPSSTITEVIAKEIIKLLNNKLKVKEISTKFNISIHIVNQIKYNKSWKHLPRNVD